MLLVYSSRLRIAAVPGYWRGLDCLETYKTNTDLKVRTTSRSIQNTTTKHNANPHHTNVKVSIKISSFISHRGRPQDSLVIEWVTTLNSATVTSTNGD